MLVGFQHQVEISSTSATLYLAGTVRKHDLPRLLAIVSSLPHTVILVRVDLHALVALAPDAVSAVRAVLQEWRVRRGGSFRLTLSTANLVAAYREQGSIEPSPGFAALPGDRHALMATFL